MFIGNYEHTIDSKGRVSLPVKFREVLDGSYENRLIVTNIARCLVAYPLDEWKPMVEKLSAKSIVQKKLQAFQRFFISRATECTIDKQGRILIPGNLREFAQLEKEVVFAGMTKKIEIWSKERYEEEIAQAAETFDQLSEDLAGLDL